MRSIQRKLGANSASTQSAQRTLNKESDERSAIFTDDSKIGKEIVRSLIAIVYDVYFSSVGPAVKHKCLTSILKMLYHSPSDLLKDVLGKIPISSYIASMLTSQDHRIVCSALQKAEILMSKLSETFHVYFRREGVMHKIKALIDNNETKSRTGSKQASSSSKTSATLEGISKHGASSSKKSVSPQDVSSSTQDMTEFSSSASTSK